MSDPFATATDGLRVKEHVGELWLIWPQAYVEKIPTSLGERDAIDADVVRLDGPEVAEPEGGTCRFFQGRLIGALRPYVGKNKPVLGRIGQGEAKRGQNPPYILEQPTDDEKEIALKYLREIGAA